MMYYIKGMTYDIIGQCSIRCGSGLRRFLVSAALVLLSLSRSALILSASAIDTIRGRPRPQRHIQMFPS